MGNSERLDRADRAVPQRQLLRPRRFGPGEVMKRLMQVGLGCIVAGVLVGILNLPLGLLVGVIGVGLIAYEAMTRPGPPPSDSVGDEFNPRYRVYLSPLRKLHTEI